MTRLDVLYYYPPPRIKTSHLVAFQYYMVELFFKIGADSAILETEVAASF